MDDITRMALLSMDKGLLIGIIRNLETRVEKLESALKEISEGRGAFSLDPLTHAGNCIENMKSLAQKALPEPPKALEVKKR